jgi:phosphatidate cytidylyltransferase
VAVGVIAVPAFLFLAWVGGLALVCLVTAIVVLGLIEFYRMAVARGQNPLAWLGILGGIVLCLGAWRGEGAVALTLAVAAVLMGALVRRSLEESWTSAATTLAGLLWIGWLGSYLILLRGLPAAGEEDPSAGARYVWLVLALTWSYDTAAYGIGVVWGRHPLFRRVSPKKSVEGAVGGLIACLLMAEIARRTFAPFLDVTDTVVLGLGVGVVSQCGDFVESMMKRNAGVKDASRVIPGHGGVLDRFDSMFFSAPFVYLYLRLAVIA